MDYRRVRTLERAEREGLLTADHHRALQALDLAPWRREFRQPKPGIIAGFIHSSKRQRFFQRIRSTPFFTYLASTRWFGQLLFISGLRQDKFMQEDMGGIRLAIDLDLCDQCNACRQVCPLGMDVPRHVADGTIPCVQCLYCYSVCPRHAIRVEGDLGFFREQLRQYDTLIRRLYAPAAAAAPQAGV